MLAGISFPERLFPCRVPLSKKFHRGELDGRGTLTFSFWVLASSLDRVSFHTHLLESIDLFGCPLYGISTVAVSFAPWTCPWLQQGQRRTFQVVFHEKRHASHEFVAPNKEPPSFQVWCRLAIHLFRAVS